MASRSTTKRSEIKKASVVCPSSYQLEAAVSEVLPSAASCSREECWAELDGETLHQVLQ